ncbi:MAG: S9 family peptidase [Clostridiales bacterium]|nr:S9 family peptidase [Candidatus Blautia equi]
MKPIGISEFCNFTFLSGVTYSPDGETLAFVASNAKLEQNKYESSIYVLKNGQTRRLTTGGKERGFVFQDNETILFMGNREEDKTPSLKSHLYRISLNGGEAEKYITFPIPVQKVLPLKNGDLVVEATAMPGYETLYKGSPALAEKFLKEQKDNEDYQVLTRNPWWWNGGTYIKDYYTALFYYNCKKGMLSRLTPEGFEASASKVSADGRYLYFFGKEVRAKENYDETGFYRMDLKTGKTDTIIQANPELFPFTYDLGTDFILLAAVRPAHGTNTNPDFYKVDYDTLEVRKYADWGESIGSTVGSDIRYGGGTKLKMDGNVCYFISTIFDAAYLYKLEDGEISRVIDKEGSVDCFDVANGKLVLNALWDMKGAELYDEKCRCLTAFNKAALRNKYTAIPEKITFMTGSAPENMHEIHGFILKPMRYDESKTYPVILDIHGGPKTVYGEVYYHEMQYWAGKGYFVIFCNPTGSDGRGNDFMDIRGKYGTVDYEDIMAFADEALRRYPQMDPERFYETGGSYGGFMTNWIIGHTNRFKACASQRSISNWFSFYGVSDIGTLFAEDQCASTPWNDPEKLWWHSPLKYADQVKTPTLFIHSEEDYRCPIDQGYQMYTALLAHGVKTRLVQFKGENHDLSRSGKPKHRVRRLQEITEWFENA